MPLCRTDRLNQLVWQSGFDSTKTVSAGNYDSKRGNYETVNAGNYETGKDASSWAALFTVPLHLFVPRLRYESCHGNQRVCCKDQRIIEHTRHNRALLYNALGKIEHCS